MGPVEIAIRESIQPGQIIRLRASGKPFVVHRIDEDGVVLLLGKKQTATRLTWRCLEGIPDFMRDRGRVPVATVFSDGTTEGTLDWYLKRHVYRATAGWVAALLEEAGVVAIEGPPPLAVRLSSRFVSACGKPVPTPTSEPERKAAILERENGAPLDFVPAAHPASARPSQPQGAGKLALVFSDGAHRDALMRRRIKFAVEKGAMARLFRRGSHAELQEELFRRLCPSRLARLNTVEEYDNWIDALIKEECWEPYSRHGLTADRWAYFAKLINIILYEVVSNRELFCDSDWRRLQSWLHLPLDSTVFDRLRSLDPGFPVPPVLKGMTEEQYRCVQRAARELASKFEIPPIWFEDAYAV